MENLLPTQYYLVLFFLAVIGLVWNKANSMVKKKLVGYVAEIRTHPVKSAMPLQLKETEVTYLGLKHDRQFCLLNKYGTFTTLRKYPKFVLIEQTILEDQIRLRVDGMSDLYLPLHMEKKDGDHVREVTIWTIKCEGVHVSEEADDWFSNYLGLTGCKLYCFPTNGPPRRPRDKGQYEVFENYDNSPNTMMYTDGSPTMILSQASLEDLNKKYTEEHLEMDRFRPNIVLSGCEPYAEDKFGRIQIGSKTILEGVYPCERCVAINILSREGVMSDKSLLKYLNKTRSGPEATLYSHKLKGGMFGFNYGVRQIGTIKVGDPVYQLS